MLGNTCSPLVLCIILYWRQGGLGWMAWGRHGLHVTWPSWRQCWGSSRRHRGATTRGRHLRQTEREKKHACFIWHSLCQWWTTWQVKPKILTLWLAAVQYLPTPTSPFTFTCLILFFGNAIRVTFMLIFWFIRRYVSGCGWWIDWQVSSSLFDQLWGIHFPQRGRKGSSPAVLAIRNGWITICAATLTHVRVPPRHPSACAVLLVHAYTNAHRHKNRSEILSAISWINTN